MHKPSVNAKFISETDPNVFNRYFASISFDSSAPTAFHYPAPEVDSGSNQETFFTDLEVEHQLRTLKSTSPGSDNIPAWVFRHCSVELTAIVKNLFNHSLHVGRVPINWLSAVVTPVPKIDKPSTVTHYRPISVTSILSRVAERMIVKKYIQPSLCNETIADQYAFKPTGSTTCALVHILHKVTQHLENCSYVRCLMIDFSKAFDVVSRTILLSKLQDLNLSHNITCWISSFLSNRTQRTKCNEIISQGLPVNLGVVQGSALGPVLFTLMVADLKPLSSDNDLIKFADDMTLLVPETSNTDIALEFNAIQIWSNNNKLPINFAKTKELVFHRPKPASPILPPCLTGIERVTVVKLLGLHLKGDFSFSVHIDFIITQCSQRMFLLRALRNRGLAAPLLEIVFSALIVSRIIYALSAWGGFVSKTEQQRLNKVFHRCRRYGYCSKNFTFESILERADSSLFRKARETHHCLASLMPNVRSTATILRDRGHPFTLPNCSRNLFKRSFINRSLFSFM